MAPRWKVLRSQRRPLAARGAAAETSKPPSPQGEDRRAGLAGGWARRWLRTARGRAQLAGPAWHPGSPHAAPLARQPTLVRAVQALRHRPSLAARLPRSLRARSPRQALPAAALHARSAPPVLAGTGGPAAVMLPAVYTVLAGLLLLPLLVNLCCPYFFQDVSYFLRLVGVARQARSYGQRRPVRTILHKFLEQARQIPHKPLLLFRDETLTYAQVDRRSNQVARTLHDHIGLRQGDCVAILMGNEPAYVWLWLGLAKLGCAMACLNYNIRAKSLLHCFQCCGAKVLLASPGEPGDRPPWQGAPPHLDTPAAVW